MKRSFFRLFLLTAFCLGQNFAGSTEQGQGSATPATKANVVLGGSSAAPGETVVVPVYFDPPSGKKVGSLKLAITFVSVNLKYDRTEPGIAADMANASVKGEATQGKNDKNIETTTVTVTASSASGGTEGLPSGLIAYVTTKINPTGRPATIALQASVEATELGTGNNLAQVTAAGTEVEVIAPGTEPAVTCFFFTH